MPWLMIYTPDLGDPHEVAEEWLERGIWEKRGDGWVGEIGAHSDEQKATNAARQARYRARKRNAARNASRNTRNAGDALRTGQTGTGNRGVTEGVTPPPSREGGCYDTPTVTPGVTPAVTRVTPLRRNAAPDPETESWRGDFAPLDPEERARARAGLDNARAALRARRSGS